MRITITPVNVSVGTTENKIIIYTSGCIVGNSGGGTWGSITGNLPDQTDLNNALGLKVDKVTGKGLSTNDYTTAEQTKLSGIQAGAQVNIIETVKVNGVALTPTAKEVDVELKTINGTAITGTGDITISGGLDKTPQTLTEDATITFDAAVSVNGAVTLTASRILGNITNAVAGEIHTVKITHGGSGSYTLTYGNQYKFSGGVLPPLSATVGAVDILSFIAVSATEFHLYNVLPDTKTP